MDRVQRKLAEIDRRREAGAGKYLDQIISTAPLFPCALGLMAGIVIEKAVMVPSWLLVILLLSGGLAAIAILFFQKQPAGFAALVLLCSCTVVSFACMGAVRLAVFYRPSAADIGNYLCQPRQLATIRGRIISHPLISDNNDWLFAKTQFSDRPTSFYLKVTQAQTTAGWTETTGLVRVQVDEPVLDLSMGDYIQLCCWLEQPKNAGNPGQFDFAEYLRQKGVCASAAVNTRAGIERLDSRKNNTFTEFKNHLRDITTTALVGDLPEDNQPRAILEALILGYRTNIDPQILADFRQTGLLHFLSLSGMNFAMVIVIVWWFCKIAGLVRSARAMVSILAAILFLLVVPPRAPAIRAAIMCFALCSAMLVRRNTSPFNSLAIAAIITLLIRPTDLFQADWQLSFASVLGIILFQRRIDLWIRSGLSGFNVLSHLNSVIPVSSAFSVSAAAWLASAAIDLYHFYAIHWLTSLWTLIASPFIAVISIAGYLKLIIAPILPTADKLLEMIIVLSINILVWLVRHIAALNISEILIGRVDLHVVAFYYLAVLFTGYVYFRRPFVKQAACASMCVLLLITVALPALQAKLSDTLAVTILDVGHGQAVVARLPDGRNFIIDAGSLGTGNVGGRIVTPFLRQAGIRKIDSIVLSHSDIDHFNGVPEIIADTPTHAVYAGVDFVDKAQSPDAEKMLENYLAAKGLTINTQLEDLSSATDGLIDLIWPPAQILTDKQIEDNDKSAVILIRYAGRSILLCSDIEKFAQQELLRLYPSMRADVIVAPHHGSRRTLLPGFLDSLQPVIIVCSCNTPSFEKKLVLQPSPNVTTCYTASDGAVTIKISKDGTIKCTAGAKQK